MKIKGLLVLALCAILFSSCFHTGRQQAPDITRDTLSYKLIEDRDDNCTNRKDTNCTIAKIRYPQFNSDSVLNDTVLSRLSNLKLPGLKPAANPRAQTKSFIAGYYKFYQDKQNERHPKVSFKLDAYAKILRQDSSLITFGIGGYSFAGGAHGGSLTLFLNWNTKAHKPIALKDILVDDYKDKLTPIAEAIFRKSENLKDTSSLARDYFFKGNKFALNNNFLITPIGIRFLYNEYEIKPYAAGVTDLFIPYAQIKPLLKPNTVVTQYIK